MTNVIIPAGGKASRLGPLTAQMPKALVMVGQRPHLIHQIEQLRKNDPTVQTITVVTSPSTDLQIRNVLNRAGVRGVVTIIQQDPLGPVHAIWTGLAAPSIDPGAGTYVLMSDTFFDESFPTAGSWVGSRHLVKAFA